MYVLLAGANQEWNVPVKPSSRSVTYRQFGLIGSFPVQCRSVGCAEGAGGCGAWLGESCGVSSWGRARKVSSAPWGGDEDELERREAPQLSGTKSRGVHHRSSASLWCCPCWAWIRSVLSSHGAAQPVEQGLRGSRWTTGMGLGKKLLHLGGNAHFGAFYWNLFSLTDFSLIMFFAI